MEKRRFIFRFRGTGPIPSDELEKIRALPEVDIVDATPRMLLIEATDEDGQALMESMPEWVVSPEQTVTYPDPRPRVAKDVNE